MNSLAELHYEIHTSDLTHAGAASSDIKLKLKGIGIPREAIRKVAIATYEGEINMIIHANGGEITVTVYPEEIEIVLEDKGKGIEDIEKAKQAGWSTASEKVREMGFGAGMGLPNMIRYTDELEIESEVGVGTRITMKVFLKE